jgi:hypothetical protein
MARAALRSMFMQFSADYTEHSEKLHTHRFEAMTAQPAPAGIWQKPRKISIRIPRKWEES